MSEPAALRELRQALEQLKADVPFVSAVNALNLLIEEFRTLRGVL
ncbi:MAG: hypothetical protein JWN70_2901 [Planctomycetaceae bacterium]|nr:hypothetical protein [Planctomycetaceae bacterium]